MDMHALQQSLNDMIMGFGDLGVFLAMFLESSVVPIPSEVIIIGAGAIGIPVVSITLFGSLGSTLGGMVGYLLGRYAAKPVILRFGRFVFIKPQHVEKAEAFALKYGSPSVFIGRLLPVIPFKVFSIAAGITKLPFVPFVLFTLAGVVPRIVLLALFGHAVVEYTQIAVLIGGFAVLVFVVYKLSRRWLARQAQGLPGRSEER